MADPGTPTDTDPERAAAQSQAQQAAEPTGRRLLIVLAVLVGVSILMTLAAAGFGLLMGGAW